MRRAALAVLPLLAAGLVVAGCSGARGGAARAAKPAAGSETPRSSAFKNEYVASPGEHFATVAEQRRAEAEALKLKADLKEGTQPARGKAKKPVAGASDGPAPGFPRASGGAPQGEPGVGGPAAAPSAPAASAPALPPSLVPVSAEPCRPSGCIGGDPCVVRCTPCPPCPPCPLHGDPDLPDAPPISAR